MKNSTHSFYHSEVDAAVGFFYNNRYKIFSLTDKQELIGYIRECSIDNRKYYEYSDYVVGGVYTKFDLYPRGCKITALVHTHPVPPKNKTNDFFSYVDLESGLRYNLYLFALETCNVRYSPKYGTSPKGEHLGKIKCK